MNVKIQKPVFFKSLAVLGGKTYIAAIFIVFRVAFLALFLTVFLFQLDKSVASAPLNFCRSYFAETDLLKSFDPTELANFHIAVRAYVSMGNKSDAESLKAKELLQTQLTKFQRSKGYNLEQRIHFSNLFQEQVRKYKQLTNQAEAQELQRLAIERQRRMDHFEQEKLKQKIFRILKKYEASDIQTALENICNQMWRNVDQLDDVKFLLELGASPNHPGDNFSAFHFAVYRGHTDIIPLLLQHGAEVDRVIMAKHTPLLLASSEGHLSIVKLLLEAGADLHQINSEGNSAFSLASVNGHLDVLKYLMSQEKNLNIQSDLYRHAFYVALPKHHVDVARFLLQSGVSNINDIGYIDGFNPGHTPLTWAVRFQYPELIQLLLDANVDTSIKNSEGKTAWDLSIRDLDIRKILEDHELAKARAKQQGMP